MAVELFFSALSGLGTLWNAFTNYSNRYDSLSATERKRELAAIVAQGEREYNSTKWLKKVTPSLQIIENRVPDFILADITNGIDRCWNNAHTILKRADEQIDKKRVAMDAAHDCICQHIKMLLSNFGDSIENLPDDLRDYIRDLAKQTNCT